MGCDDSCIYKELQQLSRPRGTEDELGRKTWSQLISIEHGRIASIVWLHPYLLLSELAGKTLRSQGGVKL